MLPKNTFSSLSKSIILKNMIFKDFTRRNVEAYGMKPSNISYKTTHEEKNSKFLPYME